MSEQLYYSSQVSGSLCLIDPSEATHCLKVMRMKKGDELNVTDGKGGWYRCRIVSENVNNCQLEIISSRSQDIQSQPAIHIATALTKNPARFEWFVEKAVETGITRITPLECSNSEKVHFKRERIEKLAIAAMKQSLRTYLPKIDNVMKFNDLVKFSPDNNCYIAVMEHTRIQGIQELANYKSGITILIGPEGDFTSEEINLATGYGYQPISFGNYRFRTETAAVFACIAANIMICINPEK